MIGYDDLDKALDEVCSWQEFCVGNNVLLIQLPLNIPKPMRDKGYDLLEDRFLVRAKFWRVWQFDW